MTDIRRLLLIGCIAVAYFTIDIVKVIRIIGLALSLPFIFMHFLATSKDNANNS